MSILVEVHDEKQAATARKIGRITERLELGGRVIRYRGLVMWAPDSRLEPAAVWTDNDLVRWWRAAAEEAANTGLSIQDVLMDTMPTSRAGEVEEETETEADPCV
jgi:hypothetical protein